MEEQFLNLNIACEMIDAIDGSKLNENANQFSRLCSQKFSQVCGGRPLTDSEFGCALSHLLVYQRMVERDLSVAVILEDDIRIGMAFKLFLRKLNTFSRHDWDLINLVSITPSIPYGEALFDIYRLSKFVEPPGSAGAYCLKLSAAEKMLGFGYPVRYASDDLIAFSENIGVKVLGLLPEVVVQDSVFQSEIGARNFHVSILDKATKYPTLP